MARILIAEDEPDIRDLIAFTIRFAGHEVFAAANGEEAIEMGKKLLPDLFVLDVRMPRMTGYEACKIIKQMPELKDIPVAFLSARGQESEIQYGLDVGAEAYWLKPFAPDRVTENIREVLQKNRLIAIFNQVDLKKSNPDENDVAYLVQQIRRRDNQHASVIQQNKEKYELETKRFVEKIKQLEDQLAAKPPAKPVEPSSFLSLMNRFFFRLFPKQLATSPEKKEPAPEVVQKDQSKVRYPLEELSRITDGIVHDMRNGIGIIRNTIGFMSDDLTGTPHAKDIVKISRSLDFCEVVLRNLSALGGKEVMRPEEVNLEKIVREICFMLESKLVDVHLVIESDDADPTILADPGHLKQVFMNLIKNAGEAMPNGGILTCRFQKDEDMMKIEIQDTGNGITLKNQKRLFNEFFTTKERGYGIGLFVVHSIIERLGGNISVKSIEHVGTTFTIELPLGEVRGIYE